jgi:hypothetical protein
MSEGLRKKYRWIPYKSVMFKKRLRGNMLSYVSMIYGVLRTVLLGLMVAGWLEIGIESGEGGTRGLASDESGEQISGCDNNDLEFCRHRHSLFTDKIFMVSNWRTHLVPWNKRPNLAEPVFRPASWAVQRWWQA